MPHHSQWCGPACLPMLRQRPKLCPYEPLPSWLRALLSLVRQRAIVQRCKASLRLSFAGCEEMSEPVTRWMEATYRLTAAIDAKVQELVRGSDHCQLYQRIREIKGFG
jgi:hypothetical protein